VSTLLGPVSLTTVTSGAITSSGAVTSSGAMKGRYLQATDPAAASSIAGPLYVTTIASPVYLTSVSGGDFSLGAVKATGASASRTLAEVFADFVAAIGYGLKGDGVTDDAAAMNAAAIAATTGKKVLRLPPATYRINSMVTFGSNVEGEGPDGTKLEFWGSGAAATFSGPKGTKLRGLRITSKGPGQTGLIAYGEQVHVEDVYLNEFDTVGLQLGVADVVGGYYMGVRNVYVNNATTWGAIGALVSGGLPSTNANRLENLVVNGKFATLLQLDGTTNLVSGGDFDPWAASTGVDVVFQVNGANNIISGSYVEQSSTKTYIPPRIVRFGANSSTNKVEGLSIRFSGYGPAAFEDLGWNNETRHQSVGFNFPTIPTTDSTGNLVFGSAFNAWDPLWTGTNARPLGWVDAANPSGSGGANYVQMSPETVTTVLGNLRSIRLTGTNADFNLQHYIYSGSSLDSSLKLTQLGALRGRMLKCSAWCLSTVANLGNIRAACSGTGCSSFGKMHHTGSGTWELLTAAAYIPSDATKVWMELRASNGQGTRLTGNIWFDRPYCTPGTTLGAYSPKTLDEGLAMLAGPLVLNPGQPITAGTTPSVAVGNIFEPGYAVTTTITNLTGGRDGQQVILVPSNGNTIVAHNSNIKTTTGANKTLVQDTPYRFLNHHGVWREF
jgi:hypothetical protein